MGTAGAASSAAVGTLLRGHGYDAVMAQLYQAVRADGSPDDTPDPGRAPELAEVARRVLDLDAEDIAAMARRIDVPRAGRLADAAFPALPRDVRGALGSLVPLYELTLEMLQGRALGRERRRDLDARVRPTLLYIESPIAALRHHAPVGHFFGVPSMAEISEAWLRIWEKVSAPWPDGANPELSPGLEARPPAGEALPGLSALVSAVAGRPIGPGRLLRDIGDKVARALDVEVLA